MILTAAFLILLALVLGVISYVFIAPLLAPLVGSTTSLLLFGILSFLAGEKIIFKFWNVLEPNWLLLIAGATTTLLVDRFSRILYPRGQYPSPSMERNHVQALGVGQLIGSIAAYFL